MSHYEAMFVLSNKEGKSGHEAAEESIKALCEKVGATIVRIGKWDERQLSYEIGGERDGVFFLAFLEGPGTMVAPLKREAELSDQVLRMLILRLDSIPSEDDVRKQSGRSKPEKSEEDEAPASDAPAAAKPAAGAPAAAAASAAAATAVAEPATDSAAAAPAATEAAGPKPAVEAPATETPDAPAAPDAADSTES